MTKKRKVVLGFFISFLIFLASLSVTTLYYYTHPPAVKALLEKSLSRITKTSVTIKTLSYSLKPPRIKARGIAFESAEVEGGFHLEVPELTAEFSLDGSFGHRSLVLRNLKVVGFALQTSGPVRLPQMDNTAKHSPLLPSVLRRIAAVMLFRDINFQAVEISGGNISVRLVNQIVRVNELRGTLNDVNLLKLSCRTQIEWPANGTSLSLPLVHLETTQAISLAEPMARFLLTAKNGVFESPATAAERVNVGAKVAYSHSSKKVSFEVLELVVKGIAQQQRTGKASLPMDLELKTTASVDLRKGELHASRFRLNLSDVAQVAGECTGYFASGPAVAITLLEGFVFPQKLKPFLPDELRRALSPLTLSGQLGLRGEIKGNVEKTKWHWDVDLYGLFGENLLSYATKRRRFSATVAGSIRAKGRFPSVALSVAVIADKAHFSGNGIEVGQFRTSIGLSGDYSTLRIDNITADIPRARVGVGNKSIPIADIQIQVYGGRLDGKEKSLILPTIRLSSSLLQDIEISLQVDEGRSRIEVKGEQTNLVEWIHALNLMPPGWDVAGSDSLRIEAVLKDENKLAFSCTLSLDELGFQSKDGDFLGEDITVKVAADGEVDLGAARLVVNTSLKTSGGEILLDRFYVDLGTNTFISSGEARYDISRHALELSNFNAGLGRIVSFRIDGTLDFRDQDTRAQLSLNLPQTPLRPIFQHFVREPFHAAAPFLSNLNVGGVLSADLNLSGQGSQETVTGHVIWRDGRITLEEKGLSLEGINLALPLWQQSDSAGERAEPLAGALSIDSMRVPLLPEQSLTVQFYVEPDGLSTEAPTALRVMGGEVRLGPVAVSNPFSRHPSIKTSLAINALDAAPLLQGLWPRLLRADVNGKLDPIVCEGGSIRSSGQATVRAFGGKVVLADLGVSGLFTAASLLRLSARIHDLSLGALTGGTPFGEIEGILGGEVAGLEIADAQPQRFDLLLETVKRKGTPQKISVRAVDNISRIGGGGSPFKGVTGLMTSFFKQFPYEKIGVQASLRNDIFHINGTIREGGTEYLVKRRGFSGVNIINQNPDNRISFKDMVKRIRRVTSGKGEPVVK